jgi:transcriptional regulator with XRE-family HTH domain
VSSPVPEPIDLPDGAWRTPAALRMLRARDFRSIVNLARLHGVSPERLALSTGLTGDFIRGVMSGDAAVTSPAQIERIADALSMPPPARAALGLAAPGRDRLHLPADFWDRPVNAQALATWDIPAALASVMTERCWNQHQMASALGYSQSWVSNVMRRAQSLTIDQARAILLQFGAPLHKLTDQLLSGPAQAAGTLDDAITKTAQRGEHGSPADDVASDKQPLDAEPLVAVLAGHVTGTGLEQPGPPSDIAVLTAAVNDARRQYQACAYSELITHLPQLLVRLDAACLYLDGAAKSRAFVLSADLHHVAAGLLLKLDDQGLAYLAADRSMRAARASEDPVTVAASARIITHVLMDGGHLAAAISNASSHAARLDRDVSSRTPESLSVYGSLLLRGAIAAAQHDQRATAHELLDEADDAARRLGADANLRWTAFGPTNAKLHRVNIAVALGDAGTAVDVARGIDLRTITVTERKAALLIDTARAFLQWGRHEKAYTALRAAEKIAHEEVAGRPSVHRLVRKLITSAPPTVRHDAAHFAARVGVSL